MATLRSDVTIDRPAEEVWAVVSDAGRISEWFPSIATSSAAGKQRNCELEGGVPLTEDIITNDPSLRRFQYRITGGGVPAQSHSGTIDVLSLDAGRSLVVYSTEITPDDLAGALGPAVDDGVQGLRSTVSAAPDRCVLPSCGGTARGGGGRCSMPRRARGSGRTGLRVSEPTAAWPQGPAEA